MATKIKKPLREAHPSTNPLSSKPIRNPLAGANWTPQRTNSMVKGLNANPKNPYAYPTTRLGLVYRSLEDGANLIENSDRLIRMIVREVSGQ